MTVSGQKLLVATVAFRRRDFGPTPTGADATVSLLQSCASGTRLSWDVRPTNLTMRRGPLGLLLFTTFVYGSGGCASHAHKADRVLNEYESALQLSVGVVDAVAVGQHIDLQLNLSNRGNRVITACLGTARQINLLSNGRVAVAGRPPVGGAVSSVDHPSCSRRLALEPGESVDWSEAIEIPNVAPGPARLGVSVEVVYPEGCSRTYGCHGTMLPASTGTIVR